MPTHSDAELCGCCCRRTYLAGGRGLFASRMLCCDPLEDRVLDWQSGFSEAAGKCSREAAFWPDPAPRFLAMMLPRMIQVLTQACMDKGI